MLFIDPDPGNWPDTALDFLCTDQYVLIQLSHSGRFKRFIRKLAATDARAGKVMADTAWSLYEEEALDAQIDRSEFTAIYKQAWINERDGRQQS